MRRFLLFFLFLSLGSLLYCQSPVQTIRGRVIDRDSRQPLAGATVVVTNIDPVIGAITDEEGNYELKMVPIGRRSIRCQFIGYTPFISEGLILNSVKELIVDVELLENSVMTDEVKLTAFTNTNEPVNELAVVSSRSFTAEETGRYAASVNDPGRMALSFPGVQQGRDDGENDIIIRGNSSVGMLWRLEGIDIPNPNHFARPGTSGGGITVFSAQLLGNSDFFSGALPAEYGNAISGAMDVHFRKGNKEEREYRAKIGLLGLDFMAEGPIKKGRSSYLANYRYSTLGLLSSMGFYLVGERVTNNFQDLSFNLAFDGKNGKDFVTVFGLGGLSQEHYLPVENPAEREIGEANQWEDRVRTSNMAAGGFTWMRLLDEKSYLKWVVAAMGSRIQYDSDTLDLSDVRYRYNSEKYQDSRLATSLTYNRKVSGRTRLKAGLHFNQIYFDYFKEDLPRNSSSSLNTNQVFGISIDGAGSTQTLQTYAQLSHSLSEKLFLSGGVHLLGFMLNNTWAADPRASIRFSPDSKQSISLGYGLHSQIQPMGTYFFTDSLGNQPNLDLPFLRSHHLILGYKVTFRSKLRLTAEVYYQSLFNVPVRTDGDEEYWMLNNQHGFPAFPVLAQGTGKNYGLDLGLEKFFSGGIFVLLTGSYFKSQYQNLSGQTFSTRFGTDWVSNLTFAKEFSFKNGKVLQLGSRVMYNGGFRYTPHDPVLSAIEGRYVPLSGAAWAAQVPAFFRIDARISYRINRPKLASVISLDVQNVMDRKNFRGVGYNSTTNELTFQKHPSGLIPVISAQFDF